MTPIDLSKTPLSAYAKLWWAVAQECFGAKGDLRSFEDSTIDPDIRDRITQITRALWDIESEPSELKDALQYWDTLRDTPRPTDARHIVEAVYQYREYRKKLIMGKEYAPWWKESDNGNR